jgi:elongation factor P
MGCEGVRLATKALVRGLPAERQRLIYAIISRRLRRVVARGIVAATRRFEGEILDMISTNQFRNGNAIRVDGKRFTILYFQHVKPGKGGAFVRTRLRNIDTGAVVEKTFRAGEKLESVRTESRPMTYLYRDGDLLYFMDAQTYEQIAVPEGVVGETAAYIGPNGAVSVLSADREVVSVEPPAHVDLEVAETDPGLKGDTATAATKPATLETRLVVQVPLFVGVGDRVRVDTRTNEYLTRV